MHSITSNVVIHVGQPLGASSRARLMQDARAIPGVVSARAHPRAGHLLTVAYDAARISAAALRARAHALGYRASLVGR